MIGGFEEYIVSMDLVKEMWRDEDCLSFAMKRSSVWQIHGLKRSREEEHSVLVETKL